MANRDTKNPYQSDLCCHNWTSEFLKFWAVFAGDFNNSSEYDKRNFQEVGSIFGSYGKIKWNPIVTFSHTFCSTRKTPPPTHTYTHNLMTMEKNESFKLHERNCQLYLHFTHRIYSALGWECEPFSCVCCSDEKIPVTVNEVRATSLAKIRFLPPIKLSLNLFRSLMHRSMHCTHTHTLLLIYMIKHFQCFSGTR